MRSSVGRLLLLGLLAALPSRVFAQEATGHGFQVSGIHYASAGDRSATSDGADLRNLGAGSVECQRLRPDGTIVPRNAFTQPARNRTNVRVQQKIPLQNEEQSPQYLKRTAGENWTMEFGFRVTF